MHSNNDLMDPNWRPLPPNPFDTYMAEKKIEYSNSHPGMFGTTHVTEWARDYVQKLETEIYHLREELKQFEAWQKKIYDAELNLSERQKYELGL